LSKVEKFLVLERGDVSETGSTTPPLDLLRGEVPK